MKKLFFIALLFLLPNAAIHCAFEHAAEQEEVDDFCSSLGDPPFQQWLTTQEGTIWRQKKTQEMSERYKKLQQQKAENNRRLQKISNRLQEIKAQAQDGKKLKESETKAKARFQEMEKKEQSQYEPLDSKGVIGLIIATGGVAIITYGTYKYTSLLYRKSVACYNAATNYIKQKIAKTKNVPAKKMAIPS